MDQPLTTTTPFAPTLDTERGSSLILRTLLLPDGEVDLLSGTVRRHGCATQRLTTRECSLLAYLAARPLAVVSRDELLTQVFGYAATVLSRTVDTTVARLRGKLEQRPDEPEVLVTAHGAGYRLVPSTPHHASPSPSPSASLSPSDRALAALPLAARPDALVLDGVVVDVHCAAVRAPDGRLLARLTPQEARILDVLARHRGRPVAPADLAHAALGRRGATRALAATMWRLREKLGHPRALAAARGRGYSLEAERRAVDLGGASEVLWGIAQAAGDVLGFEDCVIYTVDGNTLVQRAASGAKKSRDRQVLNPLAIPIGAGVVGAAAARGEAQLVLDTTADPRYIRDAFTGRSELAVPIVLDGRVVGVIDSEAQRPAAYTEADVARLGGLARLVQAAVADLRRLAGVPFGDVR